jgi:hypothetical protein
MMTTLELYKQAVQKIEARVDNVVRHGSDPYSALDGIEGVIYELEQILDARSILSEREQSRA